MVTKMRKNGCKIGLSMVAKIEDFVIKLTMMLKLYNTFSRKKEVFRPLHDKKVGLYTCGPTVYNYAHIGNLRTYIFEDILQKTLEYNGYKVKRVMNITDVGHLTSDADAGEDKLEKGAKGEGKSVWEIAELYTDDFLKNFKKINIKKAHIVAPATKNIKEQIALIRRLFKKGLAYETSQAIYFDVSRFKNYTKLSRQKLSQKIVGARDEVVIDPEKRSFYDFALWFKLVGRFKNHTMNWSSPWGRGFPGWHIECSAISTKYLGQPLDIHTGGVDHISTHHTNEIAQSEGAFGKPLARFWLHGEHLLVNQEKMAKSAGTFITLADIIKKGFNPLAFRYLILTSHYRSKLNFTWKSIGAAQNALNNLYEFIRSTDNKQSITNDHKKIVSYEKKFLAAINDDLNTPKAMALVWQVIKDNKLAPKVKKQVLLNFDKVLGLGLAQIRAIKIPEKISKLVAGREKFRTNKQFIQADALRKKEEVLGYKVEDTLYGPKITATRH